MQNRRAPPAGTGDRRGSNATAPVIPDHAGFKPASERMTPAEQAAISDASVLRNRPARRRVSKHQIIIASYVTDEHVASSGRITRSDRQQSVRGLASFQLMSSADATVAATDGWLTPGVTGIGVASLLSDAGHEVPTSLLPSLLTSTLGASASVLGVIEGVSDALAGVARLGGGALADDPSRRRAVAVGGYAATAVLSAATGGATAVWQVGALRAGAWTARGLRVPSRNALLADVVPPAAYGRAYGFERAMDNLGAIAGPLLAIGLVATVGTRWAIGLSAIPGLLAALAIIYAIRHTTAVQSRERAPIRLRIAPVLHGDLRRLFAGISAFELGNCAATLMICEQHNCSNRDTATTGQRPSRSVSMSPTTSLPR